MRRLPRLIRSVLEKAGLDSEKAGREGGVDVVGDVAILRLSSRSSAEKRRAAAAVLEQMRNVKCVFEQEGGIEGELRLRHLKHLAGEKRTLTTHKENGCAFRVDIAKCYFSPRLSTERLRMAEAVEEGESVLNMFAGVGPFSVPVAKLRGANVTSCELNSYACSLHRENNELNRINGKVEVINADSMLLQGMVRNKFDRILMPHPSAADRFLGVAVSLLKTTGTIVYYRHVLGRDEGEASENLEKELTLLLPSRYRWTTRRVREVGPRWIEMAAEIRPAR